MADKTYKYTGASSKAEEVGALRKFAGQFDPDNTYVGSLLNSAVLDWFEHQSRSDIMCDLWAYWRDERKQVQTLQGQVTTLEADLGATKKWLGIAGNERDDARAKVTELREEIGRLVCEADGAKEWQAQADRLAAENRQLMKSLETEHKYRQAYEFGYTEVRDETASAWVSGKDEVAVEAIRDILIQTADIAKRVEQE